MPRNSISRRVARAASIGGSRSYRQRTPLGWYSIVLVVCVVGLGLIVFSRHEREVASAGTSTTTTTTQADTPPIAGTHWQVALSLDICGTVVNLPSSKDKTSGIITTGNGVVDIQPSRAGKNAKQFEGANANLGKFLTQEDVSLSSTTLKLPRSLGKLAGTYTTGKKCGTKVATLELSIWPSSASPSPYTGLPYTSATYGNGELFMLGFLPKAASVPKPPAAHLVAAFVKSQIPKSTTTTTIKGGTTTTTIKGGTTTTTIKGATTTTIKPANSTTTTSGSTTTTGASSTTTSTG
ncbi:MAG: hypothetical protein ABSG36_05665 [Acidimicrobiales bacterium]